MIIPSVDVAKGRTVQLVGGRDLALEAGAPVDWLERFTIAGEVALIDLDAALGEGDQRALLAPLCRRFPVRVGGGIRDLDRARFWLDAGAAKIIIGTAATPDFLCALPRERTIAALDAIDGEVVTHGWRTRTGSSVLDRIVELRDVVGGFLLTFVEREGRMAGIDLPAVKQMVAATGNVRITVAGGVTTAQDIAALDALGVDAQVGMALYTGHLSLADAVAAPLITDRADGLFATVVVDERGTALGLAWSSRESLAQAIETRRGIYHSRRRGVWEKGATSGATQQLLRVDLDCDRDAIRFTVRQADPGFCHTGSLTCWNDAPGLTGLESTLRARRQKAVAGSYTQRLWETPSLLASKLVEEAGELAATTTAEAAVAEAADVLYFTMVKLAAHGCTLADVEHELDTRTTRVTRRPGDAKPAATPAPVAFDALRRVRSDALPPRAPSAIDAATLEGASAIVAAVRKGGDRELERFARKFDGWDGQRPLIVDAAALRAAVDAIDEETRRALTGMAARIESFALAQRRTLTELDVAVPGGRAGHSIVPMMRAGCYAPAGRFPLPSSVMMTVVTARAAGVRDITLATPSGSPIMLAAAAIAGADRVITVGGAQAIAALAYGTESLAACDVVVGPGNRWVTAAKQVVAGDIAIDFLAGPSELVVMADAESDPARIAADLLAQAEHDPDALPILVSLDAALVDRVDVELIRQLATLPTAETARAALANGYAVLCDSVDDAIAVIDAIGPEHLELTTPGAVQVAERIGNAGGLFIGAGAAEVFGDYGVGPNHVLPTGGAARFTGGLSVLTFLRVRTWLASDAPSAIARETALLARLEGLEAHARAAEMRAH